MKKKSALRVLAIVAVIMLICSGLTVGYLTKKVTSRRFYEQTLVNGYDVSEKTTAEAAELLAQQYNTFRVEIREKGVTVFAQDLKNVGYTVDQQTLQSSLDDLLQQQNQSLLASMLGGNTFDLDIPFAIDEEEFTKAVTADALSTSRTASADANLEFDGSVYYIEPEVYGNELDDRDLQTFVRDAIDQSLDGEMQGTTVTLDVPEGLYYLPNVTADDAELNRKMNGYNQFVHAQITYLFGEEQVTLDWDTLQNWIIDDGETFTISAEKAYEFVNGLAGSYDTLYYDRSFTASDGTYVTLDSNDYGYQIDQDAEYEQLLADIAANTATEREPIYAVEGYSRNGRDDLNGTYIEINLTTQHLWFYKYGSLVVETDIVSGLPKNDRETTTGAFPIAYKASPFNLKGGGGSGTDSWDVEVQYWMPFHDGQGLHDASWRTTFGGNIYQTNGSHGCVNLPEDAAQVIYENAEANMPILLYK